MKNNEEQGCVRTLSSLAAKSLFLKIRGGGARSARPALISHQGRAGALPLGPIGLTFVPVASGLFLIEENCAARNYLVVNLTCGPSLHIF